MPPVPFALWKGWGPVTSDLCPRSSLTLTWAPGFHLPLRVSVSSLWLPTPGTPKAGQYHFSVGGLLVALCTSRLYPLEASSTPSSVVTPQNVSRSGRRARAWRTALHPAALSILQPHAQSQRGPRQHCQRGPLPRLRVQTPRPPTELAAGAPNFGPDLLPSSQLMAAPSCRGLSSPSAHSHSPSRYRGTVRRAGEQAPASSRFSIKSCSLADREGPGQAEAGAGCSQAGWLAWG